jgi:hypothetical protein
MTDRTNRRRAFCDRMALLDRLIEISGSLTILTTTLVLYSVGAHAVAAILALVCITLAITMPRRFRAIKQNWKLKKEGSGYVNFL